MERRCEGIRRDEGVSHTRADRSGHTLKISPPVQEKQERAQEEPRAEAAPRRAVTRALPYLLAVVVLSAPLMFAWGAFLVYYEKARDAFGDGRVIDGVASVFQISLLVFFVACVTLTFVLAGKSLGAAAWRWSEGRPALRAGLLSARFGLASTAVVASVVALFTWLPGDEATTDGTTLKESLENAGSRVATLLAPIGEPAHAATEEDEEPAEQAEPEAAEPPKSEEPPEEAKPLAAPRREEERSNGPAPSKTSSEASSKTSSETLSKAPSETLNETSSKGEAGTTTADLPEFAPPDPEIDEAAFVPEESALEGVAEPVLEEDAAVPVDPEIIPDFPAPTVPAGEDVVPEADAPPESDAPPEKPSRSISGLPEESDSLQYNLPERPATVPSDPNAPALSG